MPFCTECGAKIETGERYCSQCGTLGQDKQSPGPVQNTPKLLWVAGALIVFIILIVAVSQANRSERATYANLTVGARSEYTLVYYMPQGSQTFTMIISVEDEEIIDGKKYYRLVYDIVGLEREVTYLREASDGVYALAGDYMHYPEYLLYPLPLAVGKTWTVNDPRGILYYHVESRENVVIEGRTYRNCYKLSYYGEVYSVGVEGHEYVHPDTGMIKMYMHMKDLGITAEAYLRQHSL